MPRNKKNLIQAGLWVGLWGAASTLSVNTGFAQSSPVSESRAPQAAQLPDGSKLILVPWGTRGVVYWASYYPLGRRYDSADKRGLAQAVALSALSGTWDLGSLDAAKEKSSLRQVDRIGANLHRARAELASQQEIRSLTEQLAKARAKAKSFAVPLGFQKSLAGLPVRQLRTQTGIDGSIVSAELPSAVINDFALMLRDLHENASLRNFHEVLAMVRKEGTSGSESAELRQACLLALQTHPLRMTFAPPPNAKPYISWQEARTFYREHVTPDGSVTVLVGDFDPASVKAALEKIFVHRRAGAKKVKGFEHEQRGERTVQVDSIGKKRLSLAYRIPRGTDLGALEILAQHLGRGRNAVLVRKLMRESGLAATVSTQAWFPSHSGPGLFTIDITAASTSAAEYEELITETRTILARLQRRGLTDHEYSQSVKALLAEERRRKDEPLLYAKWLAGRAGASLPLVLELPGRATCQSLCKELFDDRLLSLVRARVKKRVR